MCVTNKNLFDIRWQTQPSIHQLFGSNRVKYLKWTSSSNAYITWSPKKELRCREATFHFFANFVEVRVANFRGVNQNVQTSLKMGRKKSTIVQKSWTSFRVHIWTKWIKFTFLIKKNENWENFYRANSKNIFGLLKCGMTPFLSFLQTNWWGVVEKKFKFNPYFNKRNFISDNSPICSNDKKKRTTVKKEKMARNMTKKVLSQSDCSWYDLQIIEIIDTFLLNQMNEIFFAVNITNFWLKKYKTAQKRLKILFLPTNLSF